MLNLTAFLPFKITEYIKEESNDIIKNTGCIKNMLNTITETK